MIRRSGDAKALHLVDERGAVKSESRGGSSRPAYLPVGEQACSENFLTNLVFESCICNRALTQLVAFEWHWFKNAIVRKDHTARNVVLQLSDVPWPAVANHGAHGFLRNGFDRFVHRRGELLNEIFHELRDIGFPFAQWWQINRESTQAVIQIPAEFTVLNHLLEVLVGCSNDANINSRGPRASDGLKLPLLQHAQQLGLKLQRHVSYFVKKESAAIR